MAIEMDEPERLIRLALREVLALLGHEFSKVEGKSNPESTLDQSGMADGGAIVEDYLAHNEAGVALEHLIYMIHEPRLPISTGTFGLIQQAAELMGMERDCVDRIRPTSAEPPQ